MSKIIPVIQDSGDCEVFIASRDKLKNCTTVLNNYMLVPIPHRTLFWSCFFFFTLRCQYLNCAFLNTMFPLLTGLNRDSDRKLFKWRKTAVFLRCCINHRPRAGHDPNTLCFYPKMCFSSPTEDHSES